MTKPLDQNLTGKLLVAMPGIGDPRFEGSVVFLCAHSDEGTMGLVINRTADGVEADDVFEQLDITADGLNAPLEVHVGGPVEMGRGFVLHSTDYRTEMASMEVSEVFSMTASQDILVDIASGRGPRDRLLCLGYSGWGPHQLEEEIAANGWLVCDASPDIVFEAENGEKWHSALRSLGISPALLSGDAGHA
ncbi:YqgE/AlgH family protein [Celeribacter sp.]|uniref:YqgE/AlgH family protein n=1 Tax=Celeribacter sp. TaxID=1890673 RepID=UPI003A93A152